MHKFLVAAVILAVGCKGGDKCERLYDKMTALEAKDGKGEAKKVDPAEREKSIAECRADPKMAAMAECLLAIDGKPTDEQLKACIGNDDPDKKTKKADKGGGDNAAALAKLGDFADQMCNCKDAACATKVSDAMTAWGQDMMKSNPPKPTPEEAKQGEEKSKMLTTCMQKAMATPAPTP
jgi:hypothetical protein